MPSWFFSVQMIASTRWRSQFGKGRGCRVLAGRPDQRQPQVRAGEERLSILAGQALVGDDGGAWWREADGLALQHLPGPARARRPASGSPGRTPVTVPSQVTISSG
jgi:hypothetical protein